MRRRHAQFFLALVEETEASLPVATRAACFGRLEREHDNLRAALEWAIDADEAATALRLAGTLGGFWRTCGHLAEGLRWLEAALARGDDLADGVRTKALQAAGDLAYDRGELAHAATRYAECLDRGRRIADPRTVAAALHGLGAVALVRGDTAAADAYYRESLAIGRQTGNGQEIAAILNGLMLVQRDRGDAGAAALLGEESLARFRDQGDQEGIGKVSLNLGVLAEDHGDLATARARYEEALDTMRDLGHRHGIVKTLANWARSRASRVTTSGLWCAARRACC